MVKYELIAVQDNKEVVHVDYGDHWDLACHEFAKLACCFSYDSVKVRRTESIGCREWETEVASFVRPVQK